MDNKEAIEILNITCGKQIFSTANEDDIEKLKQAFNIAITAIRDSQPEWNHAPEWAQWYAKDKTGAECWFENEPLCVNNTYFASSGKMDYCTKKPIKTLYKRPKQ